MFRKTSESLTCQWGYRKSPGITKVSRIYPLGSINVCVKCHLNLCSGSLDISVYKPIDGPTLASLVRFDKLLVMLLYINQL